MEELIAAPVLSAFRADGESGRTRAPDAWRDTGQHRVCFLAGFNFSSSGREDVDVRTLGNGETHVGAEAV